MQQQQLKPRTKQEKPKKFAYCLNAKYTSLSKRTRKNGKIKTHYAPPSTPLFVFPFPVHLKLIRTSSKEYKMELEVFLQTEESLRNDIKLTENAMDYTRYKHPKRPDKANLNFQVFTP